MTEQTVAEATAPSVPAAAQPEDSDRSILLAAKGGSIVFGGAVFGYGSQLVTGILLTRLLGAEQYGQYKVAVIAGEMAASAALLGLEYAMIRFIALFAARRDKPGLWGSLQVGLGITSVTSLLIGVGLFLLARPLAVNVFHDPGLVNILRLASLIVPFSALTSVLGAATMGFSKMQFNVVSRQIAQPLARLGLLALLALLGFTAAKALTAYIAGLIVSSALLLYFLNRLFPLRQPSGSARRETGTILRFSLPAYLSNLIRNFGPSLQTMLLGSLNTMTTVGIFAAATQVSTASTLFNQSIGTASSPIVSALHGRGDKKQMAHFYKTTAKWMLMVNMPMFLVVLLLPRPILAIFGAEFESGSTALMLLAFSNLVIAAAGISDGVLGMTGNTPVKLVNSAIQTASSIGLCILFIPRWGALGAALAVLASSVLFHLLLVCEVAVLFDMLPYTMDFLKPAAAGLAALMAGWVTSQFLGTGAQLGLAAINAFVILTVYVLCILLLGLSQEDIAVLQQLRSRIALAWARR